MTSAEVELHLFEKIPELKKVGKTPDQIESYCRGFRKVKALEQHYKETPRPEVISNAVN